MEEESLVIAPEVAHIKDETVQAPTPMEPRVPIAESAPFATEVPV